MTTILGINAYHADSSSCLLRDGEIVAAVEEERFVRVKHWAGFPARAIRYCLEAADISLDQVDHVAINRDPGANWGPRLRFIALQRPSLDKLVSRLRARRQVQTLEQAFDADRELLGERYGRGLTAQTHRVDHHLCHLASAALVSPFERCLAVSIDQFGDFASSAWGLRQGPELRLEGSIYFPHSLGTFYSALTQYLGFPNYGDEYKLMGLAPYGEPRFMPQMRQIVRTASDGSYHLDLRFFRHHNERIYSAWDGGTPHVEDLFSPALLELLGPRRHKGEPLTDRHRDLARSVQARHEECVFHLLTALHHRYRVDALALAGGCAMNSVANGKVLQRTPFKQLYVQAAGGDAGGALGAAAHVCHELMGSAAQIQMRHAQWGPSFGDDAIAPLLDGLEGCSVEHIEDEPRLCLEVAKAIAEGLVVGWFQGRMEWGPRALGNRSIVCDPRRADMKSILNLKIKRRESFRPFAPSVLKEHAGDWFEAASAAELEVPFMMKVLPIKPDKRERIPAVTHVDGSGRLQTVDADTNPRYHRLIASFFELTGVPMVLNTSFNENEPIVCTPQQALDCFLRTKMDVLVLGERLVRRSLAG